MEGPGISISMVYPVMKAIVHKGLDSKRFCSFAAFDESLLQDPDARIAGEELERLMIAAADFTQDDYFGLYQGLITEFADMGVLGYVMMHSKTVEGALEAYKRYNVILCSGFQLEWELLGDQAQIRVFTQHQGGFSRHCAEDMVSSLYRLIGKLSSKLVPLQGVSFTHASAGGVEPYVDVFGVVPVFEAEYNAIYLNKEVLAYPILYADDKLLSLFESIAEETKVELSGSNLFSEQVVLWLKKKMPSLFPSLQETADYFGMSARTLQHKLKQEETTFYELSVQVRKELAISYLRRKEYSVGDIAYALHFSEPSAFQNAFKKWTGLTPGQYRIHAERRTAQA